MPEPVHPLGEVQAHLEDAELVEALSRGDRLAQELDDRDAGDGLGVLKGEEDPSARALVGRPFGDVLAVQKDLATGDRVARVAHDDVGQGRLPGAIRAHQGVDFAFAHDEVDAAQNRRALRLGVKVAEL